MRYLLFGVKDACTAYALDHDLNHSQWIHANHFHKVVGLSPSNHEFAIVGPYLDRESTTALSMWLDRVRTHK